MAVIGQGTLLQHSLTDSAYVTIAKLTEISEISLGEADDIDITSHDSSGGYREFMRGLLDAGEISFTGIWESAASQDDVITRLQTGPTSTLNFFQVVFPGSLGTWKSQGYFKMVSLNPQFDDTLQFTGAIKVSGKPTFVVP